MSMGITMSYSESFKNQVVEEISSGKYTISEARKVYGINGRATIQNWIKKRKRTDLLSKMVRVETPNEISRIQNLHQKNKELESALSEAALELHLLKASLRVAERELGYSVQKKSDTK